MIWNVCNSLIITPPPTHEFTVVNRTESERRANSFVLPNRSEVRVANAGVNSSFPLFQFACTRRKPAARRDGFVISNSLTI